MERKYYDALGVTQSASSKEIRSAYRKLARRFHPDINPNNQVAAARFKEIQLAYDVLGDDEKKRKYDTYGENWNGSEQYSQMHQQPGFSSGNFNDIGSLFGDFFGGRSGRQSTGRGANVDVTADITLEEAASGAVRTVSLAMPDPCVSCSGQGYITNSICQTCRGTGQIERPKRLEVKIPSGVETGSRIRVRGEGSPGRGNGPAGDLFLNITVKPHKTFERIGNNLMTEVSIPFLDAILGGELEAPTIDGRVRVTIPELTQNDQRIRLRGKGMPLLNSETENGDLFVKIKITLPEELKADERHLLEQLRQQND
tara:strand:+ start:588 stop:1526 length:939 start_codon:yes stop_codon:yes gene_type:complete